MQGMTPRKATKTKVHVRGMFRLKLVEDDTGRIAGDTGWRKNNIVNLGLQNLCYLLSNSAGSTQVSRAMLGTGTAPGDTDTGLNGELNTATYTRTTVTVSQVASSAVEFQFTFSSQSAHITAAVTLQNVGIINNTTSAGTLFAGNTYATSQWQTNQSVQGSYRITFSG